MQGDEIIRATSVLFVQTLLQIQKNRATTLERVTFWVPTMENLSQEWAQPSAYSMDDMLLNFSIYDKFFTLEHQECLL
jgi:hypothetical protein